MLNSSRPVLLLTSTFVSVMLGCGNKQSDKPVVASSGKGASVAPSQPLTQANDQMARAQAKKLAQEVGDATLKGNYRRIIELTHDTVVKALGGKEKAIATTTQAMSQLTAGGGGFLSYQCGEPGQLHSLGSDMFVIVPNTADLQVNNQKMRVPGYLLGISSDTGSTWKFIDSNALEDPNLRRLVPTLPSTLQLPEPQEPQELPN